MKRISILLILLVLLALAAAAQSATKKTAIEREIRKLDLEHADAVRRGDLVVIA